MNILRTLLYLLIPIISSCQTEVERLQSESLFHLKNIVGILERTAGNTEMAIQELDKYWQNNKERIMEVRVKGAKILQQMSAEEREEFGKKSMEKARPLRERIETLSRTFPNPPLILSKIQQFL